MTASEQAVLALYRQLRRRSHVPWDCTARCDPDTCTFVTNRNGPEAACLLHGTLHLCLSHSCDYTVIGDNARVCRITGIAYPLYVEDVCHWKDTLSWEHGTYFTRDNPFSKSHRLAAQREAKRAKKRRIAPQELRDFVDEATRANPEPLRDRHGTLTEAFWRTQQTRIWLTEAQAVLEGLLQSTERQHVNQLQMDRSEKKIEYDMRTYIDKCVKQGQPVFFMRCFRDFLHAERRLRNNQYLKRIPPARLQVYCARYARMAVACYARIIMPIKPCTKLKKYRLNYHVVAWCYQVAKGIAHESRWLVRPDELLERLLPPINTLAKLGYESKTVTGHGKALRLAWVQSLLA